VVELVNEGEIPMARIDDAVSRILKVKFFLGLFEHPVTTQENYPDFASENFASDARRTALESITLLKNDNNLLPLSTNAKILVCGPAANTMRPLLGGWSYSWQGNLVNEFTEKYPTIFEAIRDLAINPAQVMLEEGVTYSDTGDYRNEQKHDFAQLLSKARQADYIVVCAGENSYTETPGNTTTLDLSENQQELIKAAASSGKPVILVLAQGRPRLIREVEPLCGAILNAYLPGNYGGEAVARILFGETNPSGKLPYTYPKFAYSLEPYYHKPTEALTAVGAPEGSAFNPQYEFGFGLSYAQFSFSDLKLNQATYSSGETLKVNIKIHNHSGKAGMEVVQVYVIDHFASNTPPVKRLRAFTKVLLQPGETREIELGFPIDDLAFVNQENETLLEKGEFTLMIGSLKQPFSVSDIKVMKRGGK
jgi:beta-glucosidase